MKKYLIYLILLSPNCISAQDNADEIFNKISNSIYNEVAGDYIPFWSSEAVKVFGQIPINEMEAGVPIKFGKILSHEYIGKLERDQNRILYIYKLKFLNKPKVDYLWSICVNLDGTINGSQIE